MKIDPIIAVEDVLASSKWYQEIFGWKATHGGDTFEILKSKEGDVMLCLHRWEDHGHPTFKNKTLPTGNGLILYFRTNRIEAIRQNLATMDYAIEQDIQRNANSGENEFSLYDPNGYYLTISAFHNYGG